MPTNTFTNPPSSQLNAASTSTSTSATHRLPPSILMPELLGFSPQLLLDDIIEGANDTILQCVEGLEPFLKRWAEKREMQLREEKDKGKGRKNGKEDAVWDGGQCVEQGLFAFQTLLESHTDIAFDFLEAWSLRNIFAIQPQDLPFIVAPHQKGLELSSSSSNESSGKSGNEEAELLVEIEELRRKIRNQRALKRSYTHSVRLGRLGLSRTQARLKQLSYLTPEAIQLLLDAPEKVNRLWDVVTGLPYLEDDAEALGLRRGGEDENVGRGEVEVDINGRDTGEGRPLWEQNKEGYYKWALNELLKRRRRPADSSVSAAGNVRKIVAGSTSALARLADEAYNVASVEEVKAALGAVRGLGVGGAGVKTETLTQKEKTQPSPGTSSSVTNPTHATATSDSNTTPTATPPTSSDRPNSKRNSMTRVTPAGLGAIPEETSRDAEDINMNIQMSEDMDIDT